MFSTRWFNLYVPWLFNINHSQEVSLIGWFVSRGVRVKKKAFELQNLGETLKIFVPNFVKTVDESNVQLGARLDRLLTNKL